MLHDSLYAIDRNKLGIETPFILDTKRGFDSF